MAFGPNGLWHTTDEEISVSLKFVGSVFQKQEMADPEALLQDAATFANRAVQCDQNGLADTAIFYYTVRYKFVLGKFPRIAPK